MSEKIIGFDMSPLTRHYSSEARKLVERLTRERDEALKVLADVDRESARIRQFGERLKRYWELQVGDRCNYCGEHQPSHTPVCERGSILRDMLGPEETQRQADAAHAETNRRLREERNYHADLASRLLFSRDPPVGSRLFFATE